MSLSDSNGPSPRVPLPQQQALAVVDRDHPTAAHIVHELNNLLDGGLRNLDLARSSLEAAGNDARGQCQANHDHVLDRMLVARDAMRRMVLLLRRWTDHRRGAISAHGLPQTLGQAVREAVRLVEPAAADQQTDVRVDLSDQADTLPAGPVYTIVLNALRNSIQAMANTPGQAGDPGADPRWIQVAAHIDHGVVNLSIRDNGPGLDPSITDDRGRVHIGRTTKPHGHGVGLTLCHDAAAQLGGQVTLTNHRSRGAVLTLRYPQDCQERQDAALS